MPVPEGIRRITQQAAEYPTLLKNTRRAPQALWVRGAGVNNDLFHLASIGSRVVEEEALAELAKFLGRVCRVYGDVAQSPLVIVSGLALGVDTQSHKTALESTHTVGVLPTPINRMSPYQSISIAQEMLAQRERGTAIISEYGPVEPDQSYNKYPKERNRIISGMSRALLVSGVSRENSGSINTVNHAYSEARPIFFLANTVTANIQRLLTLVYRAKEVSDPQQFVDTLLELK